MYKALKVILSLIWLLPIGGACIGGFILVTGFATATGAPQEAVVAALACACAVIPYVLARGFAEMSKEWMAAFDDGQREKTDSETAVDSISRSFTGLGLGSKD